MPIEFKLKPSAALMATLSAVYPIAGYTASAAQVDFAAGDVKALAPDGRSRPLVKGGEIASGETIDTGSGRAQLRFSDGAQVSLQPQTQFRIDEYRFSGKADGSEKGFFSLLKGGLRTITGLVGRSNRDNYKVTTTVATIGIRGTEYSVAYGNSISVTTGEGVIEVCNAAGCLIVNSGETARVESNTTQPVMTNKKTEIPPPPAQEGQLPGFTSGNDTSSGGVPTGLGTAILPSGPGYMMATAGKMDGGEGYPYAFGGTASVTANFDGTGALVSFADSGPPRTISGGVSSGALSDGVIGWGRWTGGIWDSYGYANTIHDMHYVIGMPTPSSDMTALGGMIGTYAMIGYTYPTAWNGSTMTVGNQAVSGTMTANFAMGDVKGDLVVPLGAHTYNTSWDGWISSSQFSGSGYASGGTCTSSSCYASIAGFFAGPKASHAGLTYRIGNTDYGTISGAAAFKQTGLTPY